MSLPFIDVVVPTFNRAAMLKRAIDSLLAQDYPLDRYRITIVDDGSTDETRPLLQKAGAVRDRLRALRIEHRGAYAARNAGWQAGSGEIVAFTDDDCIADPGWLTAIARGFAENPDALGLQGKTVTVREDVTPLTHQIVVRRTDTCYQTCNMAYRRTALSTVGGFDNVSHSGDSQLGAAVLALGPVLFRSDMVVVHPPRPRTFLDRQTWGPHIDGLLRLYSRQPHFFRRHWGRNFPVSVALR